MLHFSFYNIGKAFDFYQVTNNIKIKINKNFNKNDNMNLKSLICIYK